MRAPFFFIYFCWPDTMKSLGLKRVPITCIKKKKAKREKMRRDNVFELWLNISVKESTGIRRPLKYEITDRSEMS